MDEATVMQFAADHAAKAEELDQVAAPGARLHVEFSKLYVAMARECRIGNRRANAYHNVVFKPVIVMPQPALGAGNGDGEDEFGDTAGDTSAETAGSFVGSGEVTPSGDATVEPVAADAPLSNGDIDAAFPVPTLGWEANPRERQDAALKLSEAPYSQTWEAIATRLGYGSPESAREAARTARLRSNS